VIMAIPAKQRWIIYAVALALTLVAVRWAGGQDGADNGVAAARQAGEAAKPARGAPAAAAATERVPELRLDLLGSRTSPAPAEDPFQARSWAPAPDPEAPRRRLPAPPPQAPPLPFAYMGKLVEDAATTVFLSRQDRNYVVRAGDTIDGTYRVERIAEDALVVTYLPLKIQQALPFTATATAAPAPAGTGASARSRKPLPDDEDVD